MGFKLVLEKETGKGDKDIGEQVYLAELSREYPCYLFYYPGQMPEPALEEELRSFGEATGGNLFVNLGSLGDPDYEKIASLFEIQKSPVIIITALAPLASPEYENISSYVRIDDAKLLASSERTIQCVQEVFNLFCRGEVAKAISTAKSAERVELLRVVGECVRKSLSFVWDFVSERDIVVNYAEGRFELKRSDQ